MTKVWEWGRGKNGTPMRSGGIHQKNLPNRTGEMVASHLIPRRGMGWGGSLMGLEIGGHQIPYWGRGRGQGKKSLARYSLALEPHTG